jgi:hypothetical protein
MKKILYVIIVCLLISGLIIEIKPVKILFLNIYFLVTESGRHRRQYINNAQQYANQYGIYGPGGQGWTNTNNNNNRYQNQNSAWNNNFNLNQGNRLPEWYYNSAKTIQPSIFYLITFGLFFLII